MSDNEVTVLDSALERLGYFKNRCTRLEKALEDAVEVMEFAYMNAPKQPKEIAQARDVLSDTEKQGGT